MFNKYYSSLTLTRKRELAGLAFISPFIVGFLMFFLSPLIRSLIFSFSALSLGPDGFILENVGFRHFHDAFLVDPQFRQILVASISDMLANIPILIIFSFFAASLLNQSFKGRFLARAIFFLPVILTAGIIRRIEMNDVIMQMMQNPAENALNLGLLNFDVESILVQSKLPPEFINYILLAIDRIYQVINDSGVQILIFLAGLQSIPPALFEAAKVEGATAWECFWKVTFPMVSPLVLVNLLYSIIDSFTKSDNEVMIFIHNKAFANAQFGYSTALSWIYMLVIILVLVILGFLYRKKVFYYE